MPFWLLFSTGALVPEANLSPSEGSLEPKSSQLTSQLRMLKDIVQRFTAMRVDATEYACLKALVLFKAGQRTKTRFYLVLNLFSRINCQLLMWRGLRIANQNARWSDEDSIIEKSLPLQNIHPAVLKIRRWAFALMYHLLINNSTVQIIIYVSNSIHKPLNIQYFIMSYKEIERGG